MNNYLKVAFTVVMLAFILSACDSREENRRENVLEQKADRMEEKADMTRKSGEAAADRIEKRDPGLTDSPSTDRAAEATRESTERSADQMEEQADRIREKK
jgi:hypothetical protein